jgi:glycosyltransferase involved in cell wall biosynthesis
MPKLIIHVPAYNEENNIGNVIRDILDQEYNDLSLVIHDNKSTDNTIAECINAIGGDPRAKINRGPLNIGPLAGGLRAKCHYDAEYVCYRSANDRFHKDYIVEAMDLLEHDKKIALAYSHGYLYNENLNNLMLVDEVFKIDTRNLDFKSSTLEVVSRYTYSFSLWGIYRRSILESLRTYQYVHGGDHILLAELALYGSIAPTSNRLDYRYEHRSEVDVNITKQRADSQLEEYERGISANSFLYGVKQLMPFIDMVYGHVEMYSMARIEESDKLELSHNSIAILKNRFTPILLQEASNFLNFLRKNIAYVNNLAAVNDIRIVIWLQKVLKELIKLKTIKITALAEVDLLLYKVTELIVKFS